MGGFYWETMVFNIKENKILDDNLSSSFFLGAKENHNKMEVKHIHSTVKKWEYQKEEDRRLRDEAMMD